MSAALADAAGNNDNRTTPSAAEAAPEQQQRTAPLAEALQDAAENGPTGLPQQEASADEAPPPPQQVNGNVFSRRSCRAP
jgi:hypothetical protein